MFQILLDPQDQHLIENKTILFRTSNYTHYAIVRTKQGLFPLHRLVLGLDKFSPLVVHHRDGNGLNNKRENLLKCTPMYNGQSLNKINRPKFGYIYQNKRQKWEAYYISFGKKVKKTFNDYVTAHKYLENQKEIELIKIKEYEKQMLIKFNEA